MYISRNIIRLSESHVIFHLLLSSSLITSQPPPPTPFPTPNTHTLSLSLSLFLSLSLSQAWTNVPITKRNKFTIFPRCCGGKESTCQAGDTVPSLGWEEGGNDNPLQYSCLGNSMDRGAWWATVHGVEKSRTWLNDWARDLQLRGFYCS